MKSADGGPGERTGSFCGSTVPPPGKSFHGNVTACVKDYKKPRDLFSIWLFVSFTTEYLFLGPVLGLSTGFLRFTVDFSIALLFAVMSDLPSPPSRFVTEC